MNLQTIKESYNRGQMTQEQIEWLVKRVERYEEALKEIASNKGDYYLDETAAIADEALSRGD